MLINKTLLGIALVLGMVLSACIGPRSTGPSEEGAENGVGNGAKKEMVSDVREENTEAVRASGSETILAKRAVVRAVP